MVDALGEMFPWELAGDAGDSGLLVGSLDSSVDGVLCSVELTDAIVAEALSSDFGLLVTHHSGILGGAHSPWVTDNSAGRLAALAIRGGLDIVCCHANADEADGGTADQMARRIGLKVEGPLQRSRRAYLAKVVVFAPPESVDEVSSAMARAGAGVIGDYTRCSFRAEGTGTFVPGESSRPYSGDRGRLNRVAEVRLEMMTPSFTVPGVVSRMVAAHPYEEVAYDVYRTENVVPWGRGRTGTLENDRTPDEILDDLADWAGSSRAVLHGDASRRVSRVAVAPGNAGGLVRAAVEAGCDLLATGELDRQGVAEAREAGLDLIQLGHLESERALVPAMVDGLAKRSESHGWGLRMTGYRDKEGYWG